MGELTRDDATRLRSLSRQLRQRARDAVLPGYAEKLISAAEDLEKHADQRESLR
jgi:hypothetical protein